MQTRVLPVRPEAPHAEAIAEAAAVLRRGGLVAFPTETVYGLGANALDAAAVGRIFEAKGRPADNPLIVHVADAGAARALAADWPESAGRLAQRFWPGPLTLVLPKQSVVPDIVTAGGQTVAIRVSSHPLARALLEACALPLAAPSANRSTRLSPTRADHVLRDLDGRIDLILDGGPAWGGLESTVLDLTDSPPRLLRPGLVAPWEIEAVIGRIARSEGSSSAGPARSPGMRHRHYAPRAPVELTPPEQAAERVRELRARGCRVGWLTFGPADDVGPAATMPMPPDPVGYARDLYAVLHHLDSLGVERIVIELPPDSEPWLAIHDRLRRAAASG